MGFFQRLFRRRQPMQLRTLICSPEFLLFGNVEVIRGATDGTQLLTITYQTHGDITVSVALSPEVAKELATILTAWTDSIDSL